MFSSVFELQQDFKHLLGTRGLTYNTEMRPQTLQPIQPQGDLTAPYAHTTPCRKRLTYQVAHLGSWNAYYGPKEPE